MEYILRNVPDDLRRLVKATAKAQGKSISDFIKEAIHEQMERDLARLQKSSPEAAKVMALMTRKFKDHARRKTRPTKSRAR